MGDGTGFPTHAPAWEKMAAFEVFGDHAAMPGFRLVVQVSVRPEALDALLAGRAGSAPALDPELARMSLRAGLSLVQTGVADFVYCTPEDALAVVEPSAGEGPGSSMAAHDRLLSAFVARMSLLAGQEIPAVGRIYEFPDLDVVRKALVSLQESVEETTPSRSSAWLGAQMRGRGEPFHPSMIETIEEQTALLESAGIDMESLPGWWWRGAAARVNGGEVEVIDELPHGDEFAALIR